MSFFKVFGYVVLSLAILFGVGLYACSYVAKETLKSVGDDMITSYSNEARQASVNSKQTYSTEGNKAVIKNALLVPEKGVILQGVELCNAVYIPKDTTTTSKCTLGNTCSTLVRFKKEIPATLDIQVTKDKGISCEKRTIDTKTALTDVSYKGQIYISGALKDFFLPFPGRGFKKAPLSKFQNSASFGFNGDVDITLFYDHKVSEDVFLYKEQEVRVIYDPQ